MRKSPSLTAIVVNHHTSRIFGDVAGCLAAAGVKRTVVVDNSECARERVALERICCGLPDADVRAIPNKGFADAVHHGIEASGALPTDAVWILNPDVSFPPQTPWILLDQLRKGEVEVVSPAITTGSGLPWFYGGELDLKEGRPRHLLDPALLTSSTESTFLTGTAMMMTRDTWQKTGGFPRDLFMYWEDAAFSLRCAELGLSMRTVGDAELWHKVGGSSAGEGYSELFYYFYQRNRLWVASGELGLRGRLRLLFRKEAIKWLVYPLLREPNSKARKAVSSTRGLLAGLAGRRT